ncbi:hypothetical protein LEP1GSC019_3160 [Leptospira interrogans serovar Pyrogenes str. 2006006960]|nr:hypothetical protein LEP1GSC019_3160 [Leptospira interrogans serovar Pyrogenes str. 2006006960]
MLNCRVALTSEKTIKIPPKTQTEVFRLNLIHGNVENLYGLNVGIFNSVNNSMIGGSGRNRKFIRQKHIWMAVRDYKYG